MKRLTLIAILFSFLINILSGQKPPLTHSVYDGWKSISSSAITDDGKFVTYEISPQQGDGMLFLYNLSTGRKDSVLYGSGAQVSEGSAYIAYSIKPSFGETRQAKKKKLKDDQMPKNSMGIFLIAKGDHLTIKNVKSFSVPESGSKWMAYLLEKENPKKDTKTVPDTVKSRNGQQLKSKKPPESKGTEFVILNPVTGKEFRFKDVIEYSVAREGKSISFVQSVPDTLKTETFKVTVFLTDKESTVNLFESKGNLKKLSSSKLGNSAAFLFSADTGKVKIYDLWYSTGYTGAFKAVDSQNSSMPSGWSVSENGNISFSEDGTRVYFGTAPKPFKEPEDTLLADEKFRVDIWSWDDDLLQPAQKIQLQSELKRTYLAVYHTDRKVMLQLATAEMPVVRSLMKGNSDIALGSTDLKYRKLQSWDQGYSDYFIVNIESGSIKKVLEKIPSRVSVSPAGSHVVYWNEKERNWFSVNTSNYASRNITAGIPFPLYDVDWDTPSEPAPYGIEGWVDDKNHILISDHFDIWSVDLNGIETPLNITAGEGRKTNKTFSYQQLERDEEYVSRKGNILLSSFNNENKENGYYRLNSLAPAAPQKMIEGKFTFSRPAARAKKADMLIWAKGSFETSPELYTSSTGFTEIRKLSVTNPQQASYNWATAELVEWNSFDNKRLQGILYKPEDFDPSRKYPMIVYFYEKSSDGIYSYMPPAPARSIINRVFAASNGYLVFVPDIPYEIGYPGKSCYNAVMSGTYAMLDKFSFIDKNRLALDGQSWGGYQIAYLITQTNLFRCAYSGAPVVNMISAYGGIRWGAGVSRMFQYEHTQSRIGGTLWDKPLQFVENSPIFWMPRVNTPVLIMHNDADGAVPWYQGIEFITALRRLGKPAWMLTYNDEDHNLTKRPNMKDLAIRKMQFYDHYLKDAPMPYWMKNGISQVEKGKKDGYELVNVK